MRQRALFALYQLGTTAALGLGLLLAPLLVLAGRRYRAGFAQRLGLYPAQALRAVQPGRPIWVHAASVGEVLSAVPLTRELKRSHPERPILFSTFTEPGQQMAQKASAADSCVFLPLDHAWIVRRAMEKFQPALLILLETEIWPNLLRAASRRGIPIVILSGRMSARSFRRYAKLRSFFSQVLGYVTAFGMQSRDDAERVIALGALESRVFLSGNLKHAVPAQPAQNKDAEESGALYLVVGSSHRGEEALLLDVFKLLKQNFPQIRLVLAPRHPQRFAEVEDLVRQTGLSFDKKSTVNGKNHFDKEIMLLDTIGDLPDFYAMGDVAFVGGSLVDVGGHNLLEPARFGKPVLFGPHINNFRELAAEMKRRGAGIQVENGVELRQALADLLADPAKRREVGARAAELAADDRGVLPASMALAQRYLQ
ncbi:MAG: 3-deoxy-D-manno-octulosonic acid transferase [Deltaproteobacteria bacterium]|nr:3-deoxy-D-manno-octulosonic acid transferase [Deltaproteobacteria bacterium]